MKISAPIITLLAGGALAGGLIVANGVTTGNQERSAAAVQVAGQAGGGATDDEAGDEAAKDKAQGAAAGNPAEGTPGGAASSDAKQQVRRTFAGRVKGGGPLLAISVRDGVAVAYLCDGELEAWLKGKASADRLSLTGDDGASLTASFNADRAKGSVTVGSTTWAFHTPAVKKPSGLWKATAKVRGASVQAGWVVLTDGSQVGMVTRNGAGGTAAPRLDVTTGTATIDGLPMTAVAADAETGAGF